MIRIAQGQVCWIGEEETYDKKRNKKKIRFAITVANVQRERLEYIEFDLLEDNMSLLEETRMGIGDTAICHYQDIGRMYKFVDEDGIEKVIMHQNKDCFRIEIV